MVLTRRVRPFVIWHGTLDDALALTVAIKRNCECPENQLGSCTAHQAMMDQRFLNGLLFARHLTERLLAEEFSS